MISKSTSLAFLRVFILYLIASLQRTQIFFYLPSLLARTTLHRLAILIIFFLFFKYVPKQFLCSYTTKPILFHFRNHALWILYYISSSHSHMLTCMSSIHFPFSFNSQTPFKQFNRPEGSKLYPLFPSFVCFTLCHPFPKVGDERPLFCPKFPETHLNFLFIGAAHNRCALHMFRFIVCFVSSRTKFNVFSNLSQMLFIYLKMSCLATHIAIRSRWILAAFKISCFSQEEGKKFPTKRAYYRVPVFQQVS